MNNNQTFVVVSDDFPEKGHQAYTFVEQLVVAFCELGINVKVIAPQSITKCVLRGKKRLPRYKAFQTKSGGEYEVYRPFYLSAGSTGRLRRMYFTNLGRAVERVLRKIGMHNIDVLYGHFWHNANALVKYANKYSKPLYVACGEADNAIDELLDALNPSEKNNLVKTVNGVISVSTENKRRVIKYGLSSEDKIEVFPNSVDQSLFYKKDRAELRQKLGISGMDFVISFVGSFSERKGSNRLSEAIIQLNDSSIKSFFFGKALSYDDCTPNCPGILYMDSLPHDILPDYLNASDVFVLPTLNEGCSNAIVEALCCGLPVISSDMPFNDDILDITNSIRIDPMNVDEIKNAIIQLKNDELLRDQLSKGALEKAKSLSIETRAKRIVEFINRKK